MCLNSEMKNPVKGGEGTLWWCASTAANKYFLPNILLQEWVTSVTCGFFSNRCLWLGIKLNSAGERPFRAGFEEPWFISKQTHLPVIFKKSSRVFSFFQCVWLGMELYSAGQWPSRAEVVHSCSTLNFLFDFCMWLFKLKGVDCENVNNSRQ